MVHTFTTYYKYQVQVLDSHGWIPCYLHSGTCSPYDYDSMMYDSMMHIIQPENSELGGHVHSTGYYYNVPLLDTYA